MEDIVSLLDHYQKKTPLLLGIVQRTHHPARNFFTSIFALEGVKISFGRRAPSNLGTSQKKGCFFSGKASLWCFSHLFLIFLMRFFSVKPNIFGLYSEPNIYWANPEQDLCMYESLTVNILAAIKSSYEIWVGLMVGGWVVLSPKRSVPMRPTTPSCHFKQRGI